MPPVQPRRCSAGQGRVGGRSRPGDPNCNAECRLWAGAAAHLSSASWCSRLKPEARSSVSMLPWIAATASCRQVGGGPRVPACQLRSSAVRCAGCWPRRQRQPTAGWVRSGRAGGARQGEVSGCKMPTPSKTDKTATHLVQPVQPNTRWCSWCNPTGSGAGGPPGSWGGSSPALHPAPARTPASCCSTVW